MHRFVTRSQSGWPAWVAAARASGPAVARNLGAPAELGPTEPGGADATVTGRTRDSDGLRVGVLARGCLS